MDDDEIGIMNAIIIDVKDNFTVQTSNNNIIRVIIIDVVFYHSMLNLSSVDNHQFAALSCDTTIIFIYYQMQD
jgi:hypothetical protein